jgi:hypothetical protein
MISNAAFLRSDSMLSIGTVPSMHAAVAVAQIYGLNDRAAFQGVLPIGFPLITSGEVIHSISL